MNAKYVLLATAVTFALSAPAFADDKEKYETKTTIEKDANGDYKEKDKTSKTDASGTTTTFEKKATVDVDANGDIDKSTTTKKTVDPKGLFNKHTVKTSNTEDSKNGQVTSKQKVTVDGKTVENTTDTSPQQ